MNRYGIAVSIDRCEGEKGLNELSAYGESQLEVLLGKAVFNFFQKQPHLLFPFFFGDHFFSLRYYDAAIELANFAASRHEDLNFKRWFN